MDEKERIAKVRAYLLELYADWFRKNHGGSQSEFTWNVLGVRQPTWASWVSDNNTRIPTLEFADKIAAVYGPKIYEICGYTARITIPEVSIIHELARHMTPEQREKLIECARNLAKPEKGVDGILAK